ncbi:MAG: DUF3619 domain-containing protein [Roseateles depolymerans]|uniref:DUF3619 domain-containing protein n=1 Tax=Roseateles depolymerans TaxID=76731 RepID=A0A2W5FZZ0_9BURK|nr:MAG: DUF3619 domain-containing protein [Roseateles depolymerans]
MNSPNYSATADLDARVTRFGLRIAAGLSERNAALPADVGERLRFAREQALARAQAARAARGLVAAGTVVSRGGPTLALGGGRGRSCGFWSRGLSLVPLALLLAGLLLAQRGQFHRELVAAAEVDTALLSDKLPPAAFRDPGFAEFLRDDQE